MILLFYRLMMTFYRWAIGMASFKSDKARKWITGRENWQEKLSNNFNRSSKPVIWVHCASLGEFEQGRPVIEKLKTLLPDHAVLLTFFSPSGYEVRKNYAQVDFVCYLPIDHPQNATDFIKLSKPVLAVFVKYEYWYFYLNELYRQNIPSVLISAHLHPKNTAFFARQYLRKVIPLYRHIFVQDQNSVTILKDVFDYNNVTVAGDTRFDRVEQIVHHFEPVACITEWINGRKTVVCGSVWAEDMKHLAKVISSEQLKEVCWIIAPHELDLKPQDFISTGVTFYSQIESDNPQFPTNILWVDSIGLLSRLYHYGDITYVGGGFGKGIHNTLEAVAHGKAVLFGTNFRRFREAIEMTELEIAFPCQDEREILNCIEKIIFYESALKKVDILARQYIATKSGATDKIISYLISLIKN